MNYIKLDWGDSLVDPEFPHGPSITTLIEETVHPDLVIGADIVSESITRSMIVVIDIVSGFRPILDSRPCRYHKNKPRNTRELRSNCRSSEEQIDTVMFPITPARYISVQYASKI